MKIKNIAKIVVIDNADNILLLKRSKTDSRRPGEWDFPGGGLEGDESFAQAAARELQEEAGISVEPADLRLVYAASDYYAPANESVNRALFAIHVGQAAVNEVKLSYEHDDMAWVSAQQTLLDFPHPFYSVGLKYALDHDLLA